MLNNKQIEEIKQCVSYALQDIVDEETEGLFEDRHFYSTEYHTWDKDFADECDSECEECKNIILHANSIEFFRDNVRDPLDWEMFTESEKSKLRNAIENLTQADLDDVTRQASIDYRVMCSFGNIDKLADKIIANMNKGVLTCKQSQ